jgi:hypothetical protein
MATTLKAEAGATPRERLAGISGQPVKAALRAQLPATPVREVAKDAIHRVSSQKAAAVDLALSEGRLSHKLTDGSLTLAQLEGLDPRVIAEFGKLLTERYAPLVTPQARIREQVRQVRRACDEIDSFLELVG